MRTGSSSWVPSTRTRSRPRVARRRVDHARSHGGCRGPAGADRRRGHARFRCRGRAHARHPSASRGGCISGMGDSRKHSTSQREVLEVQQRVVGGRDESTLQSMDTLAGLLAADGDVSGSIDVLQPLLAARREVSGADHPATLKRCCSWRTPTPSWSAPTRPRRSTGRSWSGSVASSATITWRR